MFKKRIMMRPEDSDSDSEGRVVPTAAGSSALEDYPLSDTTISNLRSKGIVSLFPIQTACFRPIFEGKDVIGRDRTGSGKTLAFALPILERLREQKKFGRTLGQRPFKIVIVPTRELAIQVTNEYNRFKNFNDEYRVITCYGGTEIFEQIGALRRGAEIVVGTPGRLIDLLQRRVLLLDQLRTFVLDETDQMLNFGFQEDIDNILKFVVEDFKKEGRDTREIQYLLFSATIPKWIENACQKFMSRDTVRIDMIKGRTVKTSTTVDHLAIFFKSREDKIKMIGDVVQVYGGQHCRTIIFTDKKEEGNEVLLHGKLKVPCQILNGDIPQKQREVTFQSFRDGKLKCLIATNVASRGLDFPEVDLIVQLSPPVEIDTYIHRSGRTGRAGKSGKCVTFYLKKQQELIERIEIKANIKLKKVGAPQAEDIMRSNARDISNSLSKVSPAVLSHFEENVDAILREYEPREALARTLAIISGYTQGLKRHSLLSGAEDMVTFMLEIQGEADRPMHYWNLMRKYWAAHLVDAVRGLRLLENKRGCVFEVDAKFEQDLEELAPAMQASKISLFQPKELPSLEEQPAITSSFSSHFSHSNGFRETLDSRPGLSRPGFNSTSQVSQPPPPSAAPQKKKDLKKLFVANIPQSSDDSEIKGLFEKKGYHIEDVFLTKTPEGTLKGFGYVKFADEKQAALALKELQGVKVAGRSLRLDYADQR